MLPLRPMRRGLSRMHNRYGGAARSRMRQLDLPRIFMGEAAVTFVSFAGPTTPDVGDCLSKKKTFPPRKNPLSPVQSTDNAVNIWITCRSKS